MDKRRWGLLLFALVCCAMALFSALYGSGETPLHALALPFSALGGLLRQMSLSGPWGNAGALALYAILCLLPLLPTARRLLKKQGGFGGAEWVSLLLSGFCFFALYHFINPQRLDKLFGALGRQAGGTAMAICLLSILCFNLILWFLRLSQGDSLFKSLRLILLLLSAVCLFSLCYSSLYALLRALLLPGEKGLVIQGELNFGQRQAVASALGYGNDGVILYFFRFLCAALPQILMLRLFTPGFRLLAGLEGNACFSEENALLAKAIALRARAALVAAAGCTALWNCIQLVGANSLQRVDISLNIPLSGMFFALFILCVSRHFAKSCEIYRENQEFV